MEHVWRWWLREGEGPRKATEELEGRGTIQPEEGETQEDVVSVATSLEGCQGQGEQIYSAGLQRKEWEGAHKGQILVQNKKKLLDYCKRAHGTSDQTANTLYTSRRGSME